MREVKDALVLIDKGKGNRANVKKVDSIVSKSQTSCEGPDGLKAFRVNGKSRGT